MAPADPLELAARLVCPEARAQLLEDRERLLERLAGGLLLLRLPAHYAQAEQRTAPLERIGPPVELGEGTLECLEGAVEVPLTGSEQPAAASSGGDGPGTPELARVQLVRLEVRAGLLELTQTCERLDRVRPDGARRIVHTSRQQPPGKLAQMAAGRLHISERKLEAPENAEARDGEVLVCIRLRELESVLSGCPRGFDEAEVSFDQPSNAALPRQVVGELRLLGRAR